MPKKTESTGSELDSYVGNLLVKAATKGSVTEDDIQIELKDVEVSDAQLELHRIEACATAVLRSSRQTMMKTPLSIRMMSAIWTM